MDDSQTFRDGNYPPGFRSIQQQKNVDWPEISCVFMKSNVSMDHPIRFKGEDTSPDQRSILLSGTDSADQIRTSASDRSINDLQSHENNSQSCSYSCQRARMQNTLKSHLREKFECLYEGTSQQRNPIQLNEIYTELYITESESGEISNEHEVRQIEIQSRRTATEDTPIKCNDIFKALPAPDKPIRSVLTKGVAGIGKTVSVQKFILDWAEGKENQDVHLIFPLPFREINLMKNKTLSLLDILHLFFPETQEMEISSGEYKVLFIFDGLDECRVSLDFRRSVRLCDVSESASVDVILTNLMAGNLLPSALIWITSRPAAADLIPSEWVDRVTEVRGFTDKQKEEYFSKRISDESLNNRIVSHLKSSRSLYIMCHIPVFCWISATVLERMLSEAESEGEIPKTLTQMYTHFLIIQTNIKHQKDYEKKVKSDEDMIFKLGKLAFEQLVKGNVIFYDEDLRECGIDVAEASVYSGLCTQIFREEFGLYQGKVYCFVHLTIQEHLAALYAHISFTNYNTNVFEPELVEPEPGCFSKILELVKPKSSDQILLSELHQRAVDEALQSLNGHLDLFLCFLLGLSLESIQTLLQMKRCSYKKTETVEYIKQKIKKNLSPEKFINLFHCLNELDDESLVEEIQQYVKSGSVGRSKFSSSQWSALVFVLLASEQHLGELHLNTFIGGENKADEVLMKLQPVIKESKKIMLSHCSIKNESCVDLTSALISNPSHLRELNLYKINFEGTSVDLLSGGLENPHCKLTSLRLSYCSVTAEDCAALSSALRSNPSHLRDLDLSENKLGDSGVKMISAVLENPQCYLSSLRLERCKITAKGCAALSSSLRSNPSHLTELDLSDNTFGDSGVKLISTVLENPHCKLEKLKLSQCNITDEGCVALSSALISNPSHLTHLDLSNNNNVGDSGVKLICDVLENPHCKLEKLVLRSCNITDEGCAALSSALRSNSSHLKHLDLSGNKFGDSGVKLISTALENPHCKLEKLSLMFCGITDEGRAALDSAQRSNPSHLTDLKL
ncbi:NACHT, LRR and PYD domains-containing protein 3-like [Triplophysa rosa]|uniref:NACHT, LRR and PYD domains-containing protein 3-like n=1 Tax=Triplophysa rosa TaxID=992332 RepID=UPI002545DCD7|nr:NACHT, LRR and PYD domains-containing protein 3-like [Triplophysa rosa]XP_057206601.1 NACHT, LRR and PYD domains-containing protein 3-like [Triplophysa rosa]XP_057206602.1 NACHT, LRR and PYD domains-containing protein 3-like [Triplophysa rosa]XP_057206603.1 NACHT, LRR and PYD domains-containing protein 3-like [Triplophysa rosa]